ncbi:hypothetical protein NL676_003801 [Syzygium grande]|nr:hypothetical protein NL676_003801 [Syzygium grande]
MQKQKRRAERADREDGDPHTGILLKLLHHELLQRSHCPADYRSALLQSSASSPPLAAPMTSSPTTTSSSTSPTPSTPPRLPLRPGQPDLILSNRLPAWPPVHLDRLLLAPHSRPGPPASPPLPDRHPFLGSPAPSSLARGELDLHPRSVSLEKILGYFDDQMTSSKYDDFFK